MLVLLSNDDGIMAPGLRAMYNAFLEKNHEVVAVAPMRQQSGVSHCLTVFEPLRTETIREANFTGTGVYGTPVDCVKLGLGELVGKAPDIVVAGINLGRNVGPDLFYSGTVAAASEGAHARIPSLALSHANHEGACDLVKVARHAVELAEKIATERLLPGRVINVNYPDIPIEEAKGPRLCNQSPAVWRNVYGKREDPRGWPYWWLIGDFDQAAIPPDSDMGLLAQGYITVTPLKFEYTDYAGFENLQNCGLI